MQGSEHLDNFNCTNNVCQTHSSINFQQPDNTCSIKFSTIAYNSAQNVCLGLRKQELDVSSMNFIHNSINNQNLTNGLIFSSSGTIKITNSFLSGNQGSLFSIDNANEINSLISVTDSQVDDFFQPTDKITLSNTGLVIGPIPPEILGTCTIGLKYPSCFDSVYSLSVGQIFCLYFSNYVSAL